MNTIKTSTNCELIEKEINNINIGDLYDWIITLGKDIDNEICCLYDLTLMTLDELKENQYLLIIIQALINKIKN